MSSPLITPELVAVNVDAADAHAVIDVLAQRLADAGRVTDAVALLPMCVPGRRRRPLVCRAVLVYRTRSLRLW